MQTLSKGTVPFKSCTTPAKGSVAEILDTRVSKSEKNFKRPWVQPEVYFNKPLVKMKTIWGLCWGKHDNESLTCSSIYLYLGNTLVMLPLKVTRSDDTSEWHSVLRSQTQEHGDGWENGSVSVYAAPRHRFNGTDWTNTAIPAWNPTRSEGRERRKVINIPGIPYINKNRSAYMAFSGDGGGGGVRRHTRTVSNINRKFFRWLKDSKIFTKFFLVYLSPFLSDSLWSKILHKFRQRFYGIVERIFLASRIPLKNAPVTVWGKRRLVAWKNCNQLN